MKRLLPDTDFVEPKQRRELEDNWFSNPVDNWSDLQLEKARIVEEIVDRIRASGRYPSNRTIDRLVELSDLDFEGWSTYFNEHEPEYYEPDNGLEYEPW